ncbi:hypothetical protein GCM10022225_82640 [Plantactinospora mayteni]|uniref:TipAS antibiotic-recognition domain-containing protein n=1 Tax=Plantactinospora mayteni TaxID=566021 RepID=A0ABQ4F440_9ACTN|nr:TipAS antibiotic-recognition domain-containing protein [Plantactinospora mayteni]GIH01680.1 hypothetical protein Pma05_82520 [Plantactinospora mayteni]
MRYAPELDGPDLLGWWLRQPDRRGRLRARRPTPPDPVGIRFAFYGRMSTREFQDRLSSARWQRDFAEEVIDGRGVIVAEFFDVGFSRQVPWPRRPQAARLLEALADPGRGFDAVVVGEFERAFYTPGSPEANQLVERHREVFSSYFPLTGQMQVCLGRMFEADPAFAAHYDGIRAGLASWFRRIIDANARAHRIDPHTATWQ